MLGLILGCFYKHCLFYSLKGCRGFICEAPICGLVVTELSIVFAFFNREEFRVIQFRMISLYSPLSRLIHYQLMKWEQQYIYET